MLTTKAKLELTESERKTLTARQSFRGVNYDIERAYHYVGAALRNVEDVIDEEFDYEEIKVKDIDKYKDDVAKACREARKAIIELLIEFDRIPPYPSMDREYAEALNRIYVKAQS